MQKVTLKSVVTVGGWFGGFQALMPCIGYFLMTMFQKYITAFDHWIAFILLALIGANMIKEVFEEEECECADASLSARVMFTMAVATSIDALAAGATLIVLSRAQALFAIAAIGVITFTLSAVGVKIGNVFGSRWRVGASVAGGVILILLGTKILLEHLGILVL